MRMGAFLFGGLVGAAAVMYLNRNRSGMSFAGMSSQAGDVVGKMVSAASSVSMKPEKTASSFSTMPQKDNLDEVEKLIHKDATVKQQVNEILNENGRTFMTQ